jgi:hypothetical protein
VASPDVLPLKTNRRREEGHGHPPVLRQRRLRLYDRPASRIWALRMNDPFGGA